MSTFPQVCPESFKPFLTAMCEEMGLKEFDLDDEYDNFVTKMTKIHQEKLDYISKLNLPN